MPETGRQTPDVGIRSNHRITEQEQPGIIAFDVSVATVARIRIPDQSVGILENKARLGRMRVRDAKHRTRVHASGTNPQATQDRRRFSQTEFEPHRERGNLGSLLRREQNGIGAILP